MPGGRSPRSPALLLRPLLLLCALAPGAPGPAPGPTSESRVALDVVHPVRVDAGGSFLSYELWPRTLRKRDLSAPPSAPAFYELLYQGRELRFNLSTNPHLLAPGFVTEIRRGGGPGRAYISAHTPACHLLGEVQDPELEGGLAAISACNGLKGVFQLSHEDYFIEPMDSVPSRPGQAQPHVVYKRQASARWGQQGAFRTAGTCGVQASPGLESRRELWEQRQQRPGRRRQQRSLSKDRWVETLVVADTKMVEYHGQPNVENYVLTIMNMVTGLFHDPNIGNPIHITVVRLLLLEEEEEELKVTHHADHTLSSFCRWQQSINPKEDAHPLHHDTAVLLTRKDLCSAMNQPCETVGLSHVSGMCNPHRSCSINEDTGLPLAYTVAHELGHSLGIQHDGNGNECEPFGNRPFMMSPQLLYNASPLTWSPCSRRYLTRFLDRGWGLCLDDLPSRNILSFPMVLPGVLYDVSHQCRLQYGDTSSFCSDMDSVCHTLWCTVGQTCHSKLDAAVDGTKCGDNKWCLNGECVPMDFQPEAVDGGWSGWSAWSLCSRSCGVGVQSSQRQCTQPVPKYKGRYCVGLWKRTRLCNLQACPPGHPSFRQVQCSQFDSIPYKGRLHTWVPVFSNVSPCELHCQPLSEHFMEKMRDAVIDGTPCYQDQGSRDLCINGICKNVGCDFEIDSGATEDRCGMCQGNGSTCHTVSKTFQKAEGLGYVDVGLIPAGAREIHIKELAESSNFLALRSEEDPDKYFLNGGWLIQSDGDYKVAGTTFTYARKGNLENLTSPGPTAEPVWIQLLFQESNPGVHYQYTIHREADDPGHTLIPEFSWHYGPWGKCTVTCGTGIQRQSVHCIERLAGLVDEEHCDPLDRPDDRQRRCNENLCPARWWVGEWQPCSHSCGPRGRSLRTVLCIRSVALDEQIALEPQACAHLSPPPSEMTCNQNVVCPATWAVGNWSQCPVTCGVGTRHRIVLCISDTEVPCEEAQRPPREAVCSLPSCPPLVDMLSLEGSGSGASNEIFSEVDLDPMHMTLHPVSPLPPERSPLSNAIEEDSRELVSAGPVFVDDFYYDYNFINFHEDLSDGLPEEQDPALADPVAVSLSSLDLGVPTPTSAPTLAPPELQTPAVPGTFLPMAWPGLERTSWVTTLNPRPLGPPETPGPEVAQSTRLPAMPAQARPTSSSSSTPAAWPLDPHPDEQWPPVDLPASKNASWQVGNWSQCSTTCGLGAVWRPVRCSSGLEEDCAPAGRPQPARRCHLRPCAAWHPGNWSKCSRSCGSGSSVRDVQCVDMRDLRPLRPFHCHLGPAKPPSRRLCGTQDCLSWYTSSWRECSEPCGGGEQQRLVTCPEPGLCEEVLRPNTTRPCNTHPCTQWVVGPWGQCSVTCGGGVQRRLVRCVNTRTRLPEDSDQCSHEAWPESAWPCSNQDCKPPPPPRCCPLDPECHCLAERQRTCLSPVPSPQGPVCATCPSSAPCTCPLGCKER